MNFGHEEQQNKRFTAGGGWLYLSNLGKSKNEESRAFEGALMWISEFSGIKVEGDSQEEFKPRLEIVTRTE